MFGLKQVLLQKLMVQAEAMGQGTEGRPGPVTLRLSAPSPAICRNLEVAGAWGGGRFGGWAGEGRERGDDTGWPLWRRMEIRKEIITTTNTRLDMEQHGAGVEGARTWEKARGPP